MTNFKYKLLKCVTGAVVAGTAMIASLSTAQAGVDVKVNLATQQMEVKVDGQHYATWNVSTGRRGYTTPTGRYRIQSMQKMHYSRKYNNAPMPFSVFYSGGFAIHGTNAVSRLGRVASHGCVRLRTSNAQDLYRLIKAEGRRSTKITVFRGKRVAKKRVSGRNRVASSKYNKRQTYRFNQKRRVEVASNKRKFFIFGGLDLLD